MIQVIDFLVNSLTATDANRAGQASQNATVAGQDTQADKRLEESVRASEATVETDTKDESSMVNEDGHGNGKTWLRQKKKKQEKEEAEKARPKLATDPNRGHFIDVQR